MKSFLRKNGFIIGVGFFLAVYVALMAIFTSRDYEITDALFNRSTTFGKIFEVLGPIFMPYVGIYAIVSVIMNTKTRKTAAKIAFYAFLGILYVYYFFIGSFTCKYSYLPILFVPSMVAYAFWTCACVFINKYIANKNLTDLHKKIVWVMFITVFAAMVGSDIIKPAFGRFRYTELASPRDFAPWYVVQSHQFNSSFPSGHASRSSIVLAFSLIPLYFNKKGKFLNFCIYTCCYAFIALVSISRLYEGMHYPTDLLTGIALTSFAFFVSKHLIFKTTA